MSADRDPFTSLRRPALPIEPRPDFAATLRRRVASALAEGRPEPIPDLDLGRRLPMTQTPPTSTLDPATDIPPGTVRFDDVSIVADGAADALAFYQAVFGATVSMDAFVEPDGRIGHVELDFGGRTISLADEYPEYDILSPKRRGGTTATISLRVPQPGDVDVIVDRAVARGAEVVFPVEDQFYGERAGRIRDPWGHEWRIQAKTEDLTVDQMQDRFRQEDSST